VINKNEDIAKFIEKKHSIKKTDSHRIVRDIFDYISDRVAEGDTVSIKRFGDFHPRLVKGGKLGDKVYHTTWTPKFIAKNTFKKKVKERILHEDKHKD